MSSINIVLAGCGKMGSALLRSWIKSDIQAHYTVIDPSSLPDTLAPAIHKTSVKEASAAIKQADTLILAVKPQIIKDVCESLKPTLPSKTLILSIAAGVPVNTFEEIFGPHQPVIRAMPNTPASIGKGMSVAVANTNVSSAQKDQASRLLKCAGRLEWLGSETLLNAVTALSGSGPAYVFYLIEALAKAGEKAGLPMPLAMTLARQTVIGAAALAEQSPDQDASTLRENVTSPGGTTAAALEVLMNGELQNIFDHALESARQRGEDLGE